MKATKDRIELRLRGLTTEKDAIQAELLAGSSSDRTLLRELREVKDQMAKAEIELIDEVDMKLTKDEKKVVKTKVSGLCRSAKGGVGGRKILPQ